MVDLPLSIFKAIYLHPLSFITKDDGTRNVSTGVATPKRHQVSCDILNTRVGKYINAYHLVRFGGV